MKGFHMAIEERWLSTIEAATILKICPASIRAKALKGQIPYFKMTNSRHARFRFKESEILNLVRDIEAELLEGWSIRTNLAD
jgi:hypothetical protein